MNWVALIAGIINRVPIERVLFPPPDNTKAREDLRARLSPPESPKEDLVLEKTISTITRPSPRPEQPTTEETLAQLKRRLAKECYKTEIDLANRLLINSKPCDCLNDKHSLLFEAVVEETIPLDPQNPIYCEILDWVKAAQPKATPEAISSGRYDAEYPLMALQMRDFRKRLMGSTSRLAMIEPKQQITLKEVNPTELSHLVDMEGNPLKKFCCHQCGECAPPELLEEGRFPDRIAWLRSHYKVKHPGRWGKMVNSR